MAALTAVVVGLMMMAVVVLLGEHSDCRDGHHRW